jgi:hypothetical protein
MPISIPVYVFVLHINIFWINVSFGPFQAGKLASLWQSDEGTFRA